MCLPPNEKYKLSYSWNQRFRKRQLRTRYLVFAYVNFRHFGDLKINIFTLLHFALRGKY